MPRVESQKQHAEIQLRRAEELQQLYAEIEKQEPELYPVYKPPE